MEKAEVLEFQEAIRDAVKYSCNGLAARLEKEYDIDTFNARSDSVALYRIMENLPKELKEEFLNLYQEKGRKHFLHPHTPVLDSIKLQTALLEKQGINLEVIKGNINNDSDNEDSTNEEGDSDTSDMVIVVDKNGNQMEIKCGFYSVDTLIDLTENLHKNNWLCSV